MYDGLYCRRGDIYESAVVLGATPLPTGGEAVVGHTVGSLRIQQSPLHGLGVFAVNDIQPGTPLVAVRGVLVPLSRQQTLEQQRYSWAPAVSAVTGSHPPHAEFALCQLDAARANIVRYVNSSVNEAAANVHIDWLLNYKVAVFVATQFIAAGQEVLVHYAIV